MSEVEVILDSAVGLDISGNLCGDDVAHLGLLGVNRRDDHLVTAMNKRNHRLPGGPKHDRLALNSLCDRLEHPSELTWLCRGHTAPVRYRDRVVPAFVADAENWYL
jgi:hypothetical protein